MNTEQKLEQAESVAHWLDGAPNQAFAAEVVRGLIRLVRELESKVRETSPPEGSK